MAPACRVTGSNGVTVNFFGMVWRVLVCRGVLKTIDSNGRFYNGAARAPLAPVVWPEQIYALTNTIR
jgi:hypothetical protein